MTEMVWACAVEGQWMYEIKKVEYEAARGEGQRTTEKIQGPCEADIQRLDVTEEDAELSGGGFTQKVDHV